MQDSIETAARLRRKALGETAKTTPTSAVALLCAAMAVILAPAVDATPISVTTADGVGADAWVRGGNPSQTFGDSDNDGIGDFQENFGDLTSLRAQSQCLGISTCASNNFALPGEAQGTPNPADGSLAQFTNIGFLRFDLRDLFADAGIATDDAAAKAAQIGSASLNLETKAVTNPPAGFTLGLVSDVSSDPTQQDGLPGSGGWEELGITMENRPSEVCCTSFQLGGAVFGSSGSGEASVAAPGDSLSFGPAAGDPGGILEAILSDTNGLVTLVLIGTEPVGAGFNGKGGANFFTKENTDGAMFPTLTLDIEGLNDDDMPTVSTPGSLGLLSFGLLGMVAAGRRRFISHSRPDRRATRSRG